MNRLYSVALGDGTRFIHLRKFFFGVAIFIYGRNLVLFEFRDIEFRDIEFRDIEFSYIYM